MIEEVEKMNTDQKQLSKPNNGNKFGILFIAMGLILIVSAGSYGFFYLWQVNMSLHKRITTLQSQLQQAQGQVTKTQDSVAGLQGIAQQAQGVASRQEQLLAEWQTAQKGNLTKWYVAEALYLVRLAQDHSILLHDYTQARAMLVQADQVLQTLPDPNLMAVRQALTADIARLQAVSDVNVTEVYVRLNTLNAQIDQLPLPNKPVSVDNIPAPVLTAAPQSWWKSLLDKSAAMLNKIVIVHYNTGNALPVVMPEAKAFLYQNLHAQLENAMWAVLHRNVAVYQASLARVQAWVKTYFVQDATQTQDMLNALQQLQTVQLQATVSVDLAPTIQLFDTYLGRQ